MRDGSGKAINAPGWLSRTKKRTNGWDRGHDLTELQLVQNGGLSGGVKTDHQNSHLLLADPFLEDAGEGRKCHTHLGGCLGD